MGVSYRSLFRQDILVDIGTDTATTKLQQQEKCDNCGPDLQNPGMGQRLSHIKEWKLP